jgi:glycosyltransferase involved in cell wall biosynthesis
MKISVVIPAYQAADTIKNAIASVLAQDFTDFEILVVNDGSRDKTNSMVEAVSDERIRLLTHPTNRGAAAARNTGIRAARAELVAFLDADDVWSPEKLSEQVALMEDHPEYGGCVTGFRYETEEGTSVEIPRKPDSWLREFLKGCAVAPGTTLIVRRMCYDSVGYYDESMPRHEDFDWLLRFVQKYDLGVVPLPLATVYRSGQPTGEAIGAGNEILIKRYRALFYRQGRFRGSQAVGKRWLETSIHYFMFGNKRMGFSYLLRAIRENPCQRATMYLRVIDYSFGLHFFPVLKKAILGTRLFFGTRK